MDHVCDSRFECIHFQTADQLLRAIAPLPAYSAATEHIKQTDEEELAVWALNLEYLHVYEEISLVPMPGANSSRLGAQRGIFTLTRFPATRGVELDLEGVCQTKSLWKQIIHNNAARVNHAHT